MYSSILCAVLLTWTSVVASSDLEEYTNVQDFNAYCSSSKVNSPSVTRVICDFQKTYARLGNVSLLNGSPSDGSKRESLHVEISNCTSLLLSSEFQIGWRGVYASLYLKIADTDNVVQEETVIPQQTTTSIQTSDLISLTLANSKMPILHYGLVSDTKSLLIDFSHVHLKTISKGSFRNIDQLWQFRILDTDVEHVERRAMAEALSILPAPAGVHVEWAPFIINETRITLVESESLHFHLADKGEYLNIVNSHFKMIRSGGMRITGWGHVLFADSTFETLEDDSLTIQLESQIPESSPTTLMNSPTMTMMGVEISSVNITRFISTNLRIVGGKIYLIRMVIPFVGALSSLVGQTELWNNRFIFIERWTVACSCAELAAIPKALIPYDPTPFATTPGVADDYAAPSDGGSQTTSTPPLVSSWHKELTCKVGGSTPISMTDFNKTVCHHQTPASDHDDGSAPASSDEAPVLGNSQSFLLHLAVAAACVSVTLAVVVAVCVVRRRRKSAVINQRNKHPDSGNRNKSRRTTANKKQVGVISEDPICNGEDDEDSQL